MNLTREEHFAIEAKLNFMLGVAAYDAVFPGFQIVALENGTLNVFAPTEWSAGLIENRYSYELGMAAESVLRRPVTFINVLPRELRLNIM